MESKSIESSKIPDSNPAAFRMFWLADITVRLGGRVWALALPVIAIEHLAADSRQVGYLTAATTISYLLIGLPAGVWIDRTLKRRVMIISAVVRALLLASIPAVWLMNFLDLRFLMAVAFLLGTASLFYDVSHQSYVPLLVGTNNSYKANARLEMTNRAVNASSPALVGFAMKLVGAPLLILLDAFGHLLCGFFLTRIPEVEQKKTAKTNRSLFHEMLEGLRFIAKQPALRTIAIAILLSNFFAIAITTLVPILVLKVLDLGAASLGLVFTVAELGGLTGAVLLATARKKLGLTKLLAGGLILAAACTSLVPLAAMFGAEKPLVGQALLMGSLFGTAVGGVMFAVSQISLRQMLCPKELMGRVNASMRFIVWGTIPFASIAAGFGAHYFGVTSMLWLSTVGTIITVLPILAIGRYIPASADGHA